jgi:hypothetical protein
MALANGQKVLTGPGLPHALQFVWNTVNVTVPAPNSVPNYIVVSANQYATLLTDTQFTTLVSQGKLVVSTDLPLNSQQQQYAALPTIQAQVAYLKALVITLGGPTFS